MMKTLKKTILNNLINEQITKLEVLDSITEMYMKSKEFQDLSPKERELVMRLNTNQKEYLNNIDAYIKY